MDDSFQISLEYTLLGPHSAHSIVEDVRDAFDYVSHKLNDTLPASSVRLDPSRIAVSGSSAGGYVAYVAVSHSPHLVSSFQD